MAVFNPARAIVGLCPTCEGVVVVTNDYEVWDLATCPCGWADATTALVQRLRYERGHLTQLADRTELLLPADVALADHRYRDA